VRPKVLSKLKKLIHLIGSRARDLKACSTVPTACPRFLSLYFYSAVHLCPPYTHFLDKNKTIFLISFLTQTNFDLYPFQHLPQLELHPNKSIHINSKQKQTEDNKKGISSAPTGTIWWRGEVLQSSTHTGDQTVEFKNR
jgi:hypothetical protein